MRLIIAGSRHLTDPAIVEVALSASPFSWPAPDFRSIRARLYANECWTIRDEWRDETIARGEREDSLRATCKELFGVDL